MFATGTPKNKFERRESRLAQKPAEEAEEANEAEEAEVEEPEEVKSPKETLKALMAQAKSVMSNDKDTLPAKRKQELRGFQKAVRRVLSRSGSESSNILTQSLEVQFSHLTEILKAKRETKAPKQDNKQDNKPVKRESEDDDSLAFDADEPAASDKLSAAFEKATLGEDINVSELSDEEFDTLKRALTQMRDNPIDNTKPYATPWQPRDYMSAFAFIPRYLEVNQNICAAVYLRHPVARPGSAEVPTPFGESIATPAYGWYLRRRW
jgi:hypothetical protein